MNLFSDNAFASQKIHPLIVAAGVGKRFGSEMPKQYTKLNDKTVLQHSVTALSKVAEISDCYVVISSEDEIAKTLTFDVNIKWVFGGAERMHSVFNGVKAIYQDITSLDTLNHQWVLIHDAARPCVRPSDIDKLIEQTVFHPIGKSSGGLLAVPVRDTVKKIHEHDDIVVSETTLDRSQLWLAQTPQLFPLQQLYDYLQQAIENHIAFTDEASLFEHFGHTPLLIEGSHSNIKLTFPEDKLIAEALLNSHQS